jgi:hypothetical protein
MSGTLEIPVSGTDNPAMTSVEVCVTAKSVTQRFGKLALKLQRVNGQAPKTVVCATPGHPAGLNFGFQRPLNTAGGVGTIVMRIERVLDLKPGVPYPPADAAQQTFHQPVFN